MIGFYIGLERRRDKLTLNKFANLLDITVEELKAYEADERNIEQELFINMVSHLNISHLTIKKLVTIYLYKTKELPPVPDNNFSLMYCNAIINKIMYKSNIIRKRRAKPNREGVTTGHGVT